MAAFANTEGGILFVGLADDKSIHGLENGDFLTIKAENKQDNYKLLFDNLIEQNFGNHFHSNLEEIKFYLIDDKTVCKITVKGKYVHPVMINKRVPNKPAYEAFFIRGQASTREIKGEEIKDYTQENWK
ncbi:MAG: ATP-binding protein [Flavobacterium sp.]|nr:MAG: ATP-binding protein [Flavobacterium sp.]